jgi:hypothetical protein
MKTIMMFNFNNETRRGGEKTTYLAAAENADV